jgi:hypothetical protein
MSDQIDVTHMERKGDVARIKERIASLIQRRFSEGHDTFYLSQLGSILGQDRLLLEKLTHTKLAEFIRTNLEFEIRTTGIHGNVLYIPKPGTPEAVEPEKAEIPRYIRGFWLAFAIPLSSASERRFIDIYSFEFGPDEGTLGGEDADVREIAPEFIVSQGASGSANEIAKRIDEWLEKQGLDRSPFLWQRRRTVHDGRSNLLEHLFDALSGEQLRRISLPLDVVQTLFNRRMR